MSCIFNNIMADPKTDIFSPFVFSDIMRLTFIFSPRLCKADRIARQLTGLISAT
jgi:hypothetical protein